MKGLKNTIDVLLEEDRRFKPPRSFKGKANIKDVKIYQRASQNPEQFWTLFARELDWFQPWDRVLEWNPPWVKWFLNGKLNIS